MNEGNDGEDFNDMMDQLLERDVPAAATERPIAAAAASALFTAAAAAGAQQDSMNDVDVDETAHDSQMMSQDETRSEPGVGEGEAVADVDGQSESASQRSDDDDATTEENDDDDVGMEEDEDDDGEGKPGSIIVIHISFNLVITNRFHVNGNTNVLMQVAISKESCFLERWKIF